jgi:adenine-specific DNA-methyltransferase
MATLSFKGKSFVQNYHLAVKYHELIPMREKSLTNKVSLKDNLIIHGDNLKALKALLPTYARKIKCIYIDPPYNTGTEGWKYNDNVNSPMMQEWLGKVVDKEDLTKHDKWLCMMMPRLKLLKDLLSEDGIIFVSIDENEVHHLRILMDSVFLENNFIAQLGWQKVYSTKNQSTYFSNDYEFVLCYSKSIEKASINLLPRTEEMNKRYINPDNDPRGDWKPGDLISNEERIGGHYTIKSPVTGKEFDAPQGKHWSYSKENMMKLLKDNRLWFGKDGNSIPSLKQFLSEVQQGRKASTLLFYKEFGHTDEAKKEIIAIFNEFEHAVFDTPKPVRLIKNLIILGSNKDSIILDSFAGSGTTAHAVLDLNKEDGGNRKFILVECEDYANEITAERVRRVIKGVPNAKDERLKAGLGGSFSYFELGEPIEMESILEGSRLPSYLDLARYVFYTATGEEFLPEQVDENKHFIGESKEYEVYLFYKPDLDYLKSTALTLEVAKALGDYTGKKKLVFAPTKYLDLNDSELLAKHGLKDIEYCQLPFEIYKLKE